QPFNRLTSAVVDVQQSTDNGPLQGWLTTNLKPISNCREQTGSAPPRCAAASAPLAGTRDHPAFSSAFRVLSFPVEAMPDPQRDDSRAATCSSLFRKTFCAAGSSTTAPIDTDPDG